MKKGFAFEFEILLIVVIGMIVLTPRLLNWVLCLVRQYGMPPLAPLHRNISPPVTRRLKIQ